MVTYTGLVKGTDDNMHSKLIPWSGMSTTLLIKHLHEWVECLEDEIIWWN